MQASKRLRSSRKQTEQGQQANGLEEAGSVERGELEGHGEREEMFTGKNAARNYPEAGRKLGESVKTGEWNTSQGRGAESRPPIAPPQRRW